MLPAVRVVPSGAEITPRGVCSSLYKSAEYGERGDCGILFPVTERRRVVRAHELRAP